MEMNFNEAASYAKRMKGSFTAFEKLEEVLKVAARAENAASEAETKHYALVKENAVLETRASGLEETGKELAKDNLQVVTKQRQELSQLISEARAELAQVTDEIANAEKEAREAGEGEKKKLKGEIDALKRECVATEGRLAAAQAGIAKMKLDVERLADGRV